MSKNSDVLDFAEKVLEAVEAGESPESVEEERLELAGKLQENVEIRGATRYEAGEGESLAEYVHPPANKIGVLVRLRGENPPAARRLAMHIASAAPRWVTREVVPEEEVVAERELYLRSDEVQSKPEQARGKIVEGMLGKRFFAAYPGGVLADQPWIHEPSKTVAQALSEEGLEVIEFARYALAE